MSRTVTLVILVCRCKVPPYRVGSYQVESIILQNSCKKLANQFMFQTRRPLFPGYFRPQSDCEASAQVEYSGSFTIKSNYLRKFLWKLANRSMFQTRRPLFPGRYATSKFSFLWGASPSWMLWIFYRWLDDVDSPFLNLSQKSGN